jgi:hypothetical protein
VEKEWRVGSGAPQELLCRCENNDVCIDVIVSDVGFVNVVGIVFDDDDDDGDDVVGVVVIRGSLLVWLKTRASAPKYPVSASMDEGYGVLSCTLGNRDCNHACWSFAANGEDSLPPPVATKFLCLFVNAICSCGSLCSFSFAVASVTPLPIVDRIFSTVSSLLTSQIFVFLLLLFTKSLLGSTLSL